MGHYMTEDIEVNGVRCNSRYAANQQIEILMVQGVTNIVVKVNGVQVPLEQFTKQRLFNNRL